MGRPEEQEFEISLLMKLGTVALIVTTLFQLIGMKTLEYFIIYKPIKKINYIHMHCMKPEVNDSLRIDHNIHMQLIR